MNSVISQLMNSIFNLKGGTKRVKTAVSVYLVSKILYLYGNKNYYSDAVNMVTQYCKVKKSTVLDKLYRQMQQTAAAYQSTIRNAIVNGNVAAYRQMVENHIGIKEGSVDNKIIRTFVI